MNSKKIQNEVSNNQLKKGHQNKKGYFKNRNNCYLLFLHLLNRAINLLLSLKSFVNIDIFNENYYATKSFHN